MQQVRAISLHQPWASFIAWGWKLCETRSWSTNYRGELLICAAKKRNRDLAKFYKTVIQQHLQKNTVIFPGYQDLPFGEVVAIAHLSNCELITKPPASQLETDLGNWTPGRFAWEMTNIRPLNETFPIKGQQGLFKVAPEIYTACTSLIKIYG